MMFKSKREILTSENSNDSIKYSIKRLTALIGAIIIVVMYLYLPNETDGWYIGENIYLYGFRNLILSITLLLLVNVYLFSNELFALAKKVCIREKNVLERKKPSVTKIVLVALSFVYVVISVFAINRIKIEDDCIIKDTLLSSENAFYYSELEECELFVGNYDQVYWGKYEHKYEKGTSHHLKYDIYLGKVQNVDKLIKLINEKSGRELRP